MKVQNAVLVLFLPCHDNKEKDNSELNQLYYL